MAGSSTTLLQQGRYVMPLLPLLLAAAGGLLHWHRLPRALRYLTGLVGWLLLLEAIVRLLLPQRVPYHPFPLPIAAVGELTLLALVYQAALRSAAFTRWLPVGLALFAACALASGLAAPAAAHLWPGLQLVEYVLLLLLVVLYFHKLLSELKVRHLEREPLFWVATGLSVYALGNLLIALFSHYLLPRYWQQLSPLVWDVHALLLFFFYSSYALALWMRPAK